MVGRRGVLAGRRLGRRRSTRAPVLRRRVGGGVVVKGWMRPLRVPLSETGAFWVGGLPGCGIGWCGGVAGGRVSGRRATGDEVPGDVASPASVSENSPVDQPEGGATAADDNRTVPGETAHRPPAVPVFAFPPSPYCAGAPVGVRLLLQSFERRLPVGWVALNVDYELTAAQRLYPNGVGGGPENQLSKPGEADLVLVLLHFELPRILFQVNGIPPGRSVRWSLPAPTIFYLCRCHLLLSPSGA